MRHRSKLNVKKVGLVLACLGIVGLTGCVLDEVKELGSECPNLEYIENGSDKFTCNNSGCFYYESNEIIYGIETDEYKAYSNAFTSGNCPADFSICYNSDGSRYEHDSNTEVSWDERYCGVAKDKQKCEDNEYYSSKDTICKPSSVNFCGSETNDCTRILGWKDGACTDNKCVVSDCSTGFALKDNVCVSSCGSNEYYSSTTNQCEPNTVNFCGSETNDCTRILGWKDGACTDNKCIISECSTGFALKDNVCVSSCSSNEYYSSTTSQCEPSTVNFCGSETNDCTQLLGWADGKCETNKCIVTDCIDGYDLKAGQCQSSADSCNENQYYNLTQKRCEDHNLENCGNFGKKCADIQGWANGICTSQGVCEADTCLTGYHLDGTNCVADTNEACGENAIDCETKTTGKFCSEGQCTDACTGGLATCTVDGQYICANASSDMNHCGACNTPCVTENVLYSTKVICRNSQCVASECLEGYHLNVETYACEQDSIQNCGGTDRDCSKLVSGWSAGRCDKGVCKATTCSTGYYLDGSTCVADSNTNCGKKGNTCKAGTFCSEGQCTDACTGGLQNCSGYCANTGSDMQHCGGCNIACTSTKVSNSATAICRNSQCVAESCKPGYHLNGNICEVDSPENCGQVGRDCSKLVSGWASGTCDKGVCKATTCSTGYYLDGSTCVADSNTNCGKKGNACKVGTFCSEGRCTDACTGGLQNCSGYCANTGSDMQHCGGCNIACTSTKVSNSATAICRNSQCVAESCKPGYHLNGNICEVDSPQNCGQVGRNCSTIVSGWASGTCDKGVCKASTCSTGYYLDGSTCVADSNSNCGKKGNACTAGTFCSEGRCTDACTGGLQNCSGYCANTGSDMQHCGGCNTACTATKVSNSATAICRNSQCVAESCKPGYHLNGNICEVDSPENCGQVGRDCSKIVSGWASGTCDKGVCKASTCSTGYYLDGSTCVADSNTNCGKKGNACKVGTFCSEGQCTDACTGGLQNCSGYCANTSSDMQHCGGCNIACTTDKVLKSTAVTCTAKGCAPISCATGYYPDGTTCKQYDVNNCGAKGASCKSQIAGFKTGTCTTNGVCQAATCEDNYIPVSGVCLVNCTQNQYWYNGTCVDSTIYKCGSETNDCTEAAGWASGKCTNNVCVATACKTGYQLSSGQCVPIANYVSCLGGWASYEQLKDTYHMNEYCKCIDKYMDADGKKSNGCESCDYENGYMQIGSTCKLICDSSINYYCQAKHACCSGAQACDTLSDLDKCELIYQY